MHNIDPKDIHKFDQFMEFWKTTVPPILWGMYKGFLAIGFSEKQSLYLAKSLYLDSFRRPTPPQE